MDWLFLVFLFGVPVLILIISRSRFAGRVRHLLPMVQQAEKEFEKMYTPMHLFTEKEEKTHRTKYSSLQDEVDKKILHSVFKDSVKELTLFTAFVNHMKRLGELRRENNDIVRFVAYANEKSPAAKAEYLSLFSGKRYLAENQRLTFRTNWKPLVDSIKKLKDRGLDKYLSADSNQIPVFYKSSEKKDKDRLNAEFMHYELSAKHEYFDKLLMYPLDPQQREAIITMEDNCLVVSSAGSGKTSTIEGRVHYLVDKLKVDPSKILLMTYTNKAADSLTERLGIEGLKCYTFHKLASKIITAKTGIKPSFADDTLKKVAFDAMIEDEGFIRSFNDYYANYFAATDEFDFDNAKDYFESFDRVENKAFFPDMRGRSIYTRSAQEKKICYYLSTNGVQFLYEEPYEHPTADLQHRQYKPDFTIEYTDAQGIRRRLYYEHYGINRNGETPRWFGDGKKGGWQKANADYLENIRWKRKTHEHYGTTLMSTTSADFDGNNFEEILLRKLRSYGVPIKPMSPREIYEQIMESNHNDTKEFCRLLESFLSLMKSGCKTVDDLSPDVIEDKKLRRRVSFMFEKIIKPYCRKYESLLAERHEIDFTDAIIQATKISEDNPDKPYEQIIVDEFQDISLDRFRFIQSLRGKDPFTYLFCVGDDWQSIYRFAGSDMALFKRFEDFFGFTKRCNIETTYRFGEPLIGKASEFILKNPVQTEKAVHAVSPDKVSDMEFRPYNEGSLRFVVSDILNSIPEKETVLFLGRYGFDLNVLKGLPGFTVKEKDERGEVKYNGRTCQFLSVHKAKGLEADNVILLNCNSGFYGFPSNLADDPVLKLVLSEDDQYEYGEERRLFYVAITRCKKKTFVLYDAEFPSPFVREYIPGLPEEELCPACKLGKQLFRMRGQYKNGQQYIMFGCSNYKMGCEWVDFKDDDSPAGNYSPYDDSYFNYIP